MLFPNKIQGMVGGCGLGEACDYTNTIWLSHFH